MCEVKKRLADVSMPTGVLVKPVTVLTGDWKAFLKLHIHQHHSTLPAVLSLMFSYGTKMYILLSRDHIV